MNLVNTIYVSVSWVKDGSLKKKFLKELMEKKMNKLIKHLVDNNLDKIVEKSFLNCHVEGLHSIMLIESPEQTIRLFVSQSNSKLVKNTEENIFEGRQTLAFHPHHCDITLHVIKGSLTNHIVERVSFDDPLYESRNLRKHRYFFANKYHYKSAIKDGSMEFLFSAKHLLKFIDSTLLHEKESLSLKANQIHTVTTFDPGYTAWFVYEGKEARDYMPVCYSTCEKEPDNSNLYRKATPEKIKFLLEASGLL